jgi:transcription antitermination factor NusG
VFIPTQEEIEIKNGQRIVSPQALPGYAFDADGRQLLVRVVAHAGRHGFASTTSDSQQKPTPMADAEVEQLMRDQQVAQPREHWLPVGESVVVTSGRSAT